MPKPKTPRHLLAVAVAVILALPESTTGAGFDVSEHAAAGPPASQAPAPLAGWEQAPHLSAALSFAAYDARRSRAASAVGVADLKPGPDGSIDLTLPTLLELTMRNNLDLQVRSYDPALSAEAVAARESIYDPLLRFTLALFSTTSPTAATLEGADVLSRDTASWDFEASRLIPLGGTVFAGFRNLRDETNSIFATLNPAYDSSLTFGIFQPLLRNFGREITNRDILIAKNDKGAADETFREQVMLKVFDAIDAYWRLYGHRENLSVRRAGLDLAQDLLRINKTRVEVGTMAPLEISLAEAEVARNEEQVITAEFEVKDAEDRIRQLIALPMGSAVWLASLRPIDPPVVEDRTIELERAIASAFEKRPELLRQDLVLDNDRIRLHHAGNQLKPELNLEATYGPQGLGGTQILRGDDPTVPPVTIDGGYSDALDQLVGFDFDTWRVQAVLALPVFNQLARANQAAALLSQKRDEASLEALKESVAVEVRRLVRAVETSKERIKAASAARFHQEKRVEAEGKKFEHGLSTNFEVQQSQRDLTEARANEVVAVTLHQLSLAALERATGTILERHGVRVAE